MKLLWSWCCAGVLVLTLASVNTVHYCLWLLLDRCYKRDKALTYATDLLRFITHWTNLTGRRRETREAQARQRAPKKSTKMRDNAVSDTVKMFWDLLPEKSAKRFSTQHELSAKYDVQFLSPEMAEVISKSPGDDEVGEIPDDIDSGDEDPETADQVVPACASACHVR